MQKIIKKLTHSYKENKHLFKNDVLSGITVALALVPEAIAFAFVAGVTPLLSLQTAIMIALIAAVFTGRPGMISSSTAAIAIVFAPLIATYGLEYLFATVVLMGIIQVLMGVFRLGKYTRIIPYPVVLGFLNGLAIVIFLSQLNQFKIADRTTGIETWLPPMDMAIMASFVLLTMGIIHFIPKLTKAVPAALVAIGAVTGISVALNQFGIYHLQTVADFAGVRLTGQLHQFYLPKFDITLENLRIIFPYALTGALVGLTEATLTLRVIDEMTNTRGKTNREYFAQGLANVVNGFFGGMGGDAMIGQSIINTQAGGRTRLSGLVAGLGLFLFLMFASGFVNAIPLASLVGLMFMVVISTFKWETLKYRGKIPTHDIVVIIAVTLVTIFQDLATAVIIGVILSTLIFAWEKGKALEVVITTNDNDEKVYKINGILFFGSITAFKDIFNPQTDPEAIVIDLKYAKVMDSSAIEAIQAITDKYEALGKSCIVTRAGENCKILLDNAQGLTTIKLNHTYDPTEA